VQGRNFVPKSRGTNFRFVRKFGEARSSDRRRWKRGAGGGFPFLAGGRVWGGGRGCAPSPEKFSLLTSKKAHFGGYLMHSDVLILKLRFAVHVMLKGCATDSVSFLRQAAVHGGEKD